jgi:nucleoside-diphosphate-sugar epimerase
MTATETVLLTGASGYIGPHVAKRLESSGYRVRLLLRRASAQFAGTETFIVRDFDDLDQVRPALANCSAVIHLAGRAHVFHEHAADPAAAYRRANTDITLVLAKAAREAGVARFVFMSTVKVYGEDFARPRTERDPTTPQDDYGRTKLDAELGLKAICDGGDMSYTVVRSPMVYGPDCTGNVRRLAKLIRTGLPMPLGSVRNRRSIVAVDNLADVLVRCARDAAAANETFLVGDGAPVSTPELIRGLASGLKAPARLMPFPPAALELLARLAGRGEEVRRLTGSLEFDISHLKSRLGWQPVIATDAALAQAGRSFAVSKS